jgi:TonB family protein
MIAAWMLYAVVVSGCLYVAARAAEGVLGAWRGRTRWVWVVAITLALAVPLLPQGSRTSHDGSRAAVGAVDAVGRDEAAAGVPVIPTWTVTAPRVGGDQWWVALWVIASAAVALRYVRASHRLRRLLRGAAAETVAGAPVLVVPEGAPALVGVLTPRIVVPAWLREFDAALQALVIAHEEEHRRAGDVWLVHAMALLLIALPWNLPLWLMGRRLRRAIELDCDARVLARYPDVQRYGRVLLAVAQRRGLGASLIAPALAEPVSLTEERIVAFTTKGRLGRAARVALVVVSSAAVVAACTAERSTEATEATDEVSAVVYQEVPLEVVAADTTSVAIAETKRGAADTSQVKRLREAMARARAVAADMDTNTIYKEFQVEQPVQAQPGSPGPVYPPAAKARGEEGTVLLQFVIRADSTLDVNSIRVISATSDEFANAVRAALPTMKFRAAEVGGKAVAQLVQQPFGFQLSR